MKKLFAIPAVCLLIASSCKKFDAPTQQYSNEKDAEKITKFFETNARKKESFSIDVATGGTITTTNGTKLTIPPHIFKTKTGANATGNVSVKVIDILNVSDMILNNKPTITTKGEQLVSFGEILVEADQNGDTLVLAVGPNIRPIQVVFPIGFGDAAPDGGELQEIPLWDGTNVDTSILTTSGYNHENVATTSSQPYYVFPGLTWADIPGAGIANSSETSFLLDELGVWKNCDVLIGNGPKTTVLCYMGEYFNNKTGTNYLGMEPSSVFFKLKGENSLIKLYDIIMNPIAGKEGFLSYQNSFPIGSEGIFLAISAKNDKFYAQMKTATITPESGKNYVGIQFDMQEVSEVQLLALITDMKNQ